MREGLRKFFRSERKRLKLQQAAVALRGGITQGMLSRIEIAEDYEPTFDVFERAVKGLGLTLSAFFLQLEHGLSIAELGGQTARSPDLSKVADDDALQFDSEERIASRTLSVLSKELAKALERIESLERDARARQAHHRLPSNARPTAAERRRHTRKDGAGHVPSPKKKRR